MNDRIIREPECYRLTGLTDISRRRLERRKEFPARFKITPNSGPFGAVGWRLSEVQAWIERRSTEGQAEAALASAEAREIMAERAERRKQAEAEAVA